MEASSWWTRRFEVESIPVSAVISVKGAERTRSAVVITNSPLDSYDSQLSSGWICVLCKDETGGLDCHGRQRRMLAIVY